MRLSTHFAATRFFSAVLAVALLALAMPVPAQTPTAALKPPVPPKRTLWLDERYEKVATAQQAKYRREIEFSDSIGGEIRDYYVDGKLLEGRPFDVGHYENIDKRVHHGLQEIWYASGQLKLHEEYAHGKKDGETRLFYESGRAKRRETWAADNLVKGECFAPDGSAIPFFDYLVLPVYSEGNGSKEAIVAAVARRVHYPMLALRHEQVGRVLVTFVVSEKGRVTNAHVTQSVAAPLDAAALRAVKQLRRFTPGKFDGEIAAVSFTVPINFKIE